MTAPPGNARPTSTTARPAAKQDPDQVVDPAVMRRVVNGLVTVTGCRRKRARARARAWIIDRQGLHGLDADDEAVLEAALRRAFRSDRTAVTAIRSFEATGGAGNNELIERAMPGKVRASNERAARVAAARGGEDDAA